MIGELSVKDIKNAIAGLSDNTRVMLTSTSWDYKDTIGYDAIRERLIVTRGIGDKND